MELYTHPIFREDRILTSLMMIHHLHWNDSESYPFLENDKGEILEADDYLFLEFSQPLELNISEGKVYCDGVLLFGDGCMEFHDEMMKESYHWEYFDEESIKKVEERLALMEKTL